MTPSTIAQPDFLKIKDVANRLNVSKRTIQRLIQAGEIRHVRIGRSVRVVRESIENLTRGQ